VQVIGATLDAPTTEPFDAGHRVVSLSFGGPILALGTDDKLVCVDRLKAEGREPELTCLKAAHTDQVWALAVAADGGTIASGSRDGKVRIWDVATGASRAPLTGHEDAVLAVALSPDGAMLASGGWDDRILLWDVSSGRRLRTLVGHQGGIRAVAFAADGLRLASGSEDATLRVWDIETGLSMQTLRGSGADVDAVALGPTAVVLGDAVGFLRTWDLSALGNRQELATFGAFTRPASAVTFLGENALAAASWDRTIKVFPLDDLSVPRPIGQHDDDITALRSSADGRLLASASKDGTARIWHMGPDAEPTGGVIIIAPEADMPPSTVRDVAFTPDGKVLGTASDDGKLRLFDAATGAKLHETGLGGPQLSLAFSRNGQLLAAAGQDGRIIVLDASTLAAKRLLQGHKGAVWQVAFAPGASAPATLLVSASDDGSARLWDVENGTQIGPDDAAA
jgi:WD40 repeat protein